MTVISKHFKNKPVAETVVFLSRSAMQNHTALSKPAAAASEVGNPSTGPWTGLNLVLDR